MPTTIIASVLVIGALIFIHELGHFLAARRVGVGVYEFALGFGPRVFGFTRGITDYSLRLIPLGGFVRMAGMHPGEEDEEGHDLPPRRSFSQRTVLERMFVISAGSGMNFILAMVLFTVLFGFMGISEALPEVESLEAGFPADQAGMAPGDQVLAIDGQEIRSWDHLVLLIQGSVGDELRVNVERDGELLTLTLVPVPHPDDPATGVIGIRPVVRTKNLGLVQSIGQGFRMTGLVIMGFFHGLAGMFQGTQGPEVVGIIGIGQEIGAATRMGLPNLIFLAAVISASLGLINLLPIPALDGSRLVFLGFEGFRGRPVDPDKENFIHFVGFAVLLALAVIIAYRDIVRLGS